MTVDLLVVSYNTKDMLIRLLETLNSDYEPGVWKLYIADNGSSDGTREWLEDLYDGDGRNENYHIEGVSFNENIGYSAAINLLASISDSEYLCAVNADTWFTTNHVKQVVASFERKPAAAVIGVKQHDENYRIRHGGIFWDRHSNPAHRAWAAYDPMDEMCKDEVQCWTVSGSIYYMRRDVWDILFNCPTYRTQFPQAGGAFLPTKHYFEETYYSQHAQHHGWEVWYDGTVETAGHSWNASSGGSHNQTTISYFEESKLVYAEACNRHGIQHEIAGLGV